MKCLSLIIKIAKEGGMKEIYTGTRKQRIPIGVQEFDTGYIQTNRCDGANQYWGGAQLPIWVWNSLGVGERIPSKYIFKNEAYND